MSRSRSKAYPPTYELMVQTVSSGTPAGPWTYQMSGGSETMIDEVVDNFFAKLENGQIINNDCAYTDESWLSSGGSDFALGYSGYWYRQIGGSVTIARFPIETSLVPPEGQFTQANGLHALSRAYANVDASEHNFGEDLFELGETLRFVKSPMRSLAELGLAFKRKVKSDLKTKKARSITEASANAWSTYRFAATPLLLSAVDLLEVATTKKTQRPKRTVARGFDVENGEYSDVLTLGTDPIWKGPRSFLYNSVARAYVIYEVENPLITTPFRLGFRKKDWPLTIWQILPLSFMVDRVVDISSSISGITNMVDPGVKIQASGIVWKNRLNAEITCEAVLNGPTWIYGHCYGDTVSKETFTYVREANPVFTLSEIAVPNVHLDGLVRDAQSIVDLCALVIQRFTKPLNLNF